jgi:hypothetical protein
VDLKEACEKFPPAPNELGIVASMRVAPAWSGKNLGISGTTDAAVLYDSECVIQGVAEWEPQNPGFKAMMGFYFNGVGPEPSQQITIKHHINAIGRPWGVGEIATFINDKLMPRQCADESAAPNGVSADYWRTCNFDAKGLWPWVPGYGGNEP